MTVPAFAGMTVPAFAGITVLACAGMTRGTFARIASYFRSPASEASVSGAMTVWAG